MARPSRTGGKKSAAKARKARAVSKPAKTQRSVASTAIRSKRPPASALGEELKDAREQQAATAEILRVIARSPSDVKPVFQAIAERTNKLVGGYATAVLRIVGNMAELAAFTRVNDEADAAMQSAFPIAIDGNPQLELMRRGEMAEIVDIESEMYADLPLRKIARARGFRSRLLVPLKSDTGTIGAISVSRVEPGRFDEHHVQLLQTFADQAVIAIQNARLFNETKESLERQTATADILKVIASSPNDVQPVFEAIAERSNRLIGGFSTAVFRFIDGAVHLAALTSVSCAGDEAVRASYPRPIGDYFVAPHAGNVLAIADTEDYPDVRLKSVGRIRGFRSIVYVPLMSSGSSIGAIGVGRKAAGPFSPHHVALLQTFADQAVIAIENVELFEEVQAKTRDIQESLQQQTATSEVLQVISSSMGDVQPVFEQMLKKATRVCGAEFGVMGLLDGEMYRRVALHNVPPVYDATVPREFRLLPETPNGTARDTRQVVKIDDLSKSEWYISRVSPSVVAMVEVAHVRTLAVVPMLKDGEPIGTISIFRQEVRPYIDRQIELLKNFASQAVIAIENARLFNETKEALERQTATADILKVIASSPSDVQPVFEAIADRSNRLIESLSTAVYSIVGDTQYLMAFTRSNPEADAALQASFPRSLSTVTWGDRIRNGEIVQVPDFEATVEWAEQPALRKMSQLRGFRGLLLIPLRRDEATIGVISVTRKTPGAFAAHHVQLLQTFAAQAVIAIENARLFNETKEALARQTATSDVLKVIASSPSNLQPVFDAIAERSNELMNGHATTVFRFNGEIAELAAFTSVSPEADAVLRAAFPRPLSTLRDFEEVSRGKIAETIDAAADTEPETSKNIARARGFRGRLVVPLKSDSGIIGAISITRKQPGSFAPQDVELLRTFADQAVIAIQNVDLFEEVQAKTHELEEALKYQTGSANILSVIASSPTDVKPVLTAIVESACALCEAYDAIVVLKDGEYLRFSAHHGPIPMNVEKWPINRTWTGGRAFLDARTVHVHDLFAERDEFPEGFELAKSMGHRTVVSVPLLREGQSIGAIILRRTEIHPFSDKQIALLQTFSDQAVIAIGNVRLFDEVQQRTRELSKSLDDLRTAQDRLIQTEKLASLGQLTAGIAHEIKNPLNFVNNFSALSVELTGELDDVLKPVPFDNMVRKEVDELTGLLKDNLEKVLQHGKRADSIVKNMLLHSREGSGEHRSADINALVEESLNLAYHGARAEKPGFTITLKHDLDPNAGALDLYPQEITRALLNLISNGFYAAITRKAESGDETFEPILSAATRDLGETVEIRIRDNGTGISPEVRAKIFNPFFTTKPTGEGTGLGLSMTHDIIVKQHGGRIDVETEPGTFTEFTITLPRGNGIADG